ncbi:MAG TPA: FkbM family methyltransferase, partial [Dehalococcoidia bacterium]|nr:FkbM family methyltransferase [Dehalococcoidia bacterium]
PAFCKIDTEGYEPEVLQGLSRPLRALSFEYNPLAADLTLAAVDRLTTLGDYEFNPSRGDHLRLEWPSWGDSAQVAGWLQAQSGEAEVGDIYARVKGAMWAT